MRERERERERKREKNKVEMTIETGMRSKLIDKKREKDEKKDTGAENHWSKVFNGLQCQFGKQKKKTKRRATRIKN